MTFTIYYSIGLVYTLFVIEQLDCMKYLASRTTEATAFAAAAVAIGLFGLVWPALMITHVFNCYRK